jgi:hypothetical protein
MANAPLVMNIPGASPEANVGARVTIENNARPGQPAATTAADPAPPAPAASAAPAPAAPASGAATQLETMFD